MDKMVPGAASHYYNKIMFLLPFIFSFASCTNKYTTKMFGTLPVGAYVCFWRQSRHYRPVLTSFQKAPP
jgi:hypothetical protein